MKEFEMSVELAKELLDNPAGYITEEGKRLLLEFLSDEEE